MDQAERLTARIAQLVRVVEGGRGVGADPGDHRRRDALLLAVLEQLAGMDAVHELHRDEVIGVDLPEVVDVDDVRMAQLGGELGLAEEHLEEVRRVREVREDALDGDPTIEAFEPLLLGKEDLGHPAAGDPPQKDVLTEADAALGGRGHFAILAPTRPPSGCTSGAHRCLHRSGGRNCRGFRRGVRAR